MSRIVIDSFFLSCPINGKTSDYETYVYNLIHLKKVVDYFRLFRIDIILLSSTAMDILTITNTLPPWKPCEIDYFVDRKDIQKIVYSLLKNLPRIENETHITEILSDNCKYEPADLLGDRSQEFVLDFIRLLIYVSLLKDVFAHTNIILLSKVVTGNVVKFEGTLVDIEGEEPNVVNLPLPIEEEIEVVDEPYDLFSRLNPLSLGKIGLIETAIILHAMVNHGTALCGTPLNPKLEFFFGPEFKRTLWENGVPRNETLLKAFLSACADTVARRNLGQTHPLRVNEDGNSPQITRRDGAKAWRRDIDYEYHLHYWQTDVGQELSCVCPHNDYRIF